LDTKYIRDYSTLLTGRLTGNIAVTYLGSYALTYTILSVDEEDGNENSSCEKSKINDNSDNGYLVSPNPCYLRRLIANVLIGSRIAGRIRTTLGAPV
jgi:hypothetical protein